MTSPRNFWAGVSPAPDWSQSEHSSWLFAGSFTGNVNSSFQLGSVVPFKVLELKYSPAPLPPAIQVAPDPFPSAHCWQRAGLATNTTGAESAMRADQPATPFSLSIRHERRMRARRTAHSDGRNGGHRPTLMRSLTIGSGASPRAFVRTLSALSTLTTMVGPSSPILALAMTPDTTLSSGAEA